MYSVLLILVLLVLAASLGSWLFSQWLSGQRRASALTIGIGGMGCVLLLGAAAVAILSTTNHLNIRLPGLGDTAGKVRGVTVAALRAGHRCAQDSLSGLLSVWAGGRGALARFGRRSRV